VLNCLVLRHAVLTRALEGELPKPRVRNGGALGSALLKLFQAPPFNSCNAFIHMCKLCPWTTLPKTSTAQLQRTPATFTNSVWRRKPRSAVDFFESTRILLGPKSFPPSELELTIENVCFGAVFHIWFRQGKS